MIDKRLTFELFTALLLLTMGTLLTLAGLSGWGLVIVACLIGGSSIAMRALPQRATSA
ncbi:hypothetical protein GCM10011352_24940 [Marinobacterium zhoushanense]|uniref:Uncharacterized protein n=1 Tax=Marinobacterium zhoushanense TaxID=1679163 RepID=A0ABQ1KJH3_9GAMM|nr:hypothetical protein [Marinobacterium zhoushanense]GGB97845.1 hypothetical protein GCM10011352_24940 [Marinobacterium zhoushanense]